MSPKKVAIDNAQFILCYLLIAADGQVSEDEKETFLNVVTKVGNFTKTYSESVFNGMHKFAKSLNYNHSIETLQQATPEQKTKTIEFLRELSFADKTYHADEVAFIVKVQHDLQLV